MLCYFLSYSLNGELRDLLSEVNDRQVPKGKWHTPIIFLSILYALLVYLFKSMCWIVLLLCAKPIIPLH